MGSNNRVGKGLSKRGCMGVEGAWAIKEGQLRGFRKLRRHRGACHGERGGGEGGGRALLHGPLGYKGGGRGWGGRGSMRTRGWG